MKRRDFNKLAACAFSALSIGQLPQLPKKEIYQERLLIDYSECKSDEYGEMFRRVFSNKFAYRFPSPFLLNKLYLKSNGDLWGIIYVPYGNGKEEYHFERDLDWKIYQYSPTGDVIKVLTKEDFRI